MEDTRERGGLLEREKEVGRSPEKAVPGLSLMRAGGGRFVSWKNSSGVSFGDARTEDTGAGLWLCGAVHPAHILRGGMCGQKEIAR